MALLAQRETWMRAALTLADFAGEREAKDGVDDVVCFLQCAGEVVCEGHREVAELGC